MAVLWCWRWKPKRRQVLGCKRRPSRPVPSPSPARWDGGSSSGVEPTDPLERAPGPAQPLGPSFSCKTSREEGRDPPFGDRSRQRHRTGVIPPRHPEHIKHRRAQVPLCPLSFFSFPLIILLFCPRTFTPVSLSPSAPVAAAHRGWTLCLGGAHGATCFFHFISQDTCCIYFLLSLLFFPLV